MKKLIALGILITAWSCGGESKPVVENQRGESVVKEKAPSKESKNVEIEFRKIDIDGNEKYNIVKPIFKDNEKYKEINAKLDKQINEQNIKDSLKESCDMYPEDCDNLEMIVKAEVIYEDENVVSLSMSHYVYIGGVHGDYDTSSLMVDKKTGKEIKDILGSSKKEIDDRLVDYIIRDPHDTFSLVTGQGSKEIKNKEYTVMQTSKNTFDITYPTYTLSPFIYGEPTFEYDTKTKKLYYYNPENDDKKEEIK